MASQSSTSTGPADAAAEEAYLESCKELKAAIGTLESSLVAFAGREGIRDAVFAQTKARLEQELARGPASQSKT